MISRSTYSQAFTLLEVMAVLIIISLALGLVLIKGDNITPRFELGKACDDIASTLRDARNRAIVDGKVIRLELYPETHAIEYYYEDEASALLAYESGAETPFMTKDWSERVSLEKAVIGIDEALDHQTVVLRFWPTGLCTPVRLYVKHDRGMQRTVRLNPLTGLTTIVIGYEEPETYELKTRLPTRPDGAMGGTSPAPAPAVSQ